MRVKRARKLERTAYHEAGHAVVSIALGRGLGSLEIVADNDKNQLGCCRITPVPKWFHPDIAMGARSQAWLEREIVVLLAGLAAEAKFTGRRNWRAAASDLNAALDLACCAAGYGEGPRKYLDWLYFKAESVLAQSWHWRAVQYTAAELLQRRRISGRDARQLYWKAKRDDCEEGTDGPQPQGVRPTVVAKDK
jgi:hypothetical protein